MYNYYEAMKQDVKDYIHNNPNEIEQADFIGHEEDLLDHLSDILWTEDSVTGNGSGSYTFNTSKAKDYVMDNLDLAKEAFEEWGSASEAFEKMANDEWEYIDVTIRCHILSSVIWDVVHYDEDIQRYIDSDYDESESEYTYAI